MRDDQPLDRFDPRFSGADAIVGADTTADRALVDSTGPGPNRGDPKVKVLRWAMPLLAVAAILVIATIFFAGLRPSSAELYIGTDAQVRAAVIDRPRRVCLNDTTPPCAWIVVVDDRVTAFNTNGPLPEEYGRFGVSWCASSGYFGSNSTGSRWDQQGRYVSGPTLRSLDRFTVLEPNSGGLIVDFASLTAGRAQAQVDEVGQPTGPDCEEIPFDRDPDLTITPR